MLTKIPAKYRKAIYVVAALAAIAAFAAGIINPEQVNEGVKIAGEVVALISAILALANVTPDEDTTDA